MTFSLSLPAKEFEGLTHLTSICLISLNPVCIFTFNKILFDLARIATRQGLIQ
jgi:hypothetical protein